MKTFQVKAAYLMASETFEVSSLTATGSSIGPHASSPWRIATYVAVTTSTCKQPEWQWLDIDPQYAIAPLARAFGDGPAMMPVIQTW